jgi:hypothetical protein
MKRIQKAALAVIAASSMAFAAGNLWGPNSDDFPSLQVQVPDVIKCNTEGPGGNDCNEEAAGWWFGYADDGNGNSAGAAEVKLISGWTNFANQDLTDTDNGEPKIAGALEVRLSTTNQKYANAAVAFKFYPDATDTYWGGNTNPGVENITSKNGYCMTYTLADADDPMEMELGWNEKDYCYDTYYVKVPPAYEPTVLNKVWADFKKDNWLTSANISEQSSCNQTLPLTATKETALEKATMVKIRVRNDGVATARNNILLTIYQFGWAGTCDTQGITPILAGGPKSSPVSFELIGKTLSLLSVTKPASVQIINIHGAVVHTQTVSSPSDKINLSGLPTGVYLVRAPALGYVNKIALK